jgi:alcohol dehydrogenase YqhD (iron-dependent ADH family)
MTRFTLPRDLYHGKGSLEALKTLKGKKAMVVVGGGSMKRYGFLDKVLGYLQSMQPWIFLGGLKTTREASLTKRNSSKNYPESQNMP